jgi:hypothetical protein
MEVLTDLLPDFMYPVVPGEGASVSATLEGRTVGTVKEYPSSGRAVYLGFRPRDDQSRSTGRDVATLFDILTRLGSYSEGGAEALSRPAGSRYIVNRFPNGAVSLANHMRTLREGWYGSFFRDEEEDAKILQHVELTPDAIELDELELFGRRISYAGKGALTYRLDACGRLDGFAGRNTTGITIGGTVWRFTDTPADIAWLRLADEDLETGVAEAYAVKCSEPCRLRLPFDGTGTQAAFCGNDLHEVRRSMEFTASRGTTVIDIGRKEQGQWLVVYRSRG